MKHCTLASVLVIVPFAGANAQEGKSPNDQTREIEACRKAAKILAEVYGAARLNSAAPVQVRRLHGSKAPAQPG